MQSANAELVALIRGRLPMRYYGGETFWSLQIAASLTRMSDSVEAAMRLMEEGFDIDGQTVVRSLYEQVVTLAWVAIDPLSGPVTRLDRWRGSARWERLRLHNDAVTFGETALTQPQITAIRRFLGMDDNAGNHLRPKPLPDRILPDVTRRALDADVHWHQALPGFHPADHLLGFRGLYLPAFRVTSQSVHASAEATEPYITFTGTRYVVDRARPFGRIHWALVCPLFGLALTIAAQHVNWIDAAHVRAIVDHGT